MAWIYTGPRSSSKKELERCGISSICLQTGEITGECGHEWIPMLLPGGRKRPGWWICPNECNHPGVKGYDDKVR